MTEAESDPTHEEPADPPRRRFPFLIVIPAILIVGAAIGTWWFFFRDDSPPAATIQDVRETLDDRAQAGDSQSGEGRLGNWEEVEGTWAVDHSIGSFDDFSGNFAGYRIQEELATVGAATAVGRTPEVTGEMVINGDQVTEASFEVDMTTLTSDEGFRDNRLKSSGLETDSFPTSSFTLTEPLELPEDAISGEELTYEAHGELTLHGVTREITVELDALLEDETIGIVASAPIALADYDIDKPTAPSVVSIRDEGTFELQVFLSRL